MHHLPAVDPAPDPKQPLLSAQLAALDTGRDSTIGEIAGSLDVQAFGAVMFVFASPNLVPNPPGTSPLLGAPLVFLSVQLLLGRDRLWLPQWIRKQPVSQRLLSAVTGPIRAFVLRVEHLLRPRFGVLVETTLARRVIGLVALPLALFLLLPLPFLHILPGAAMTCLAAGLAERDGLAVAAGHLLALASLLVAVAIVMLGHAGLMALWPAVAGS